MVRRILKSIFSSISDAAIVVISRLSGELYDLPADGFVDGTSALELTQEEKDMLAMVSDNFDTVIVLLNTTNAMECDFLVDPAYGIDAALWIGYTGTYGLNAVSDILVGNVNPSGHLVDTYCYDNTTNPAMVAFPFGYGLSYTTFDWSGYSCSYNSGSDSFEIKVTVKNTGNAAGKEVVQAYFQSPYTDYDKKNGIEKTAVELCGFAKTAPLDPGASETVTIEVPREELACYDRNGAKTYILEAGDYSLTAARNAHEAVNNVLAAHFCWAVRDAQAHIFRDSCIDPAGMLYL